MPYGTIKVDNITFTNGGSDTTITVSGLAASTTGDLTVTGTISGAIVRATTVSGVTVTGTTVQGASGTFTSITGGVATITSGVFALGSATAPSISFSGDADNGIYSPGANQVAITTSGTQRFFIGATGDIGINVNDPGYRLDIGSNDATAGIGYALRIRANSTAAAAAIQFTNNPVSVQYGYIACDSSNNLKFAAGNSERVRIDGSGRLLVGTSTARANFYNSTVNSQVLLESNSISSGERILANVHNSASANGPIFLLAKSRSASIGGNTVVVNGDALGTLDFQGNDGSEFVLGARIQAEVDGTPGANDMPGRLVFSTTADGAASPTERLRIDSTGQLEAASLGSAAAPVWTFLSDTDTGIYSPGANQVAISTNGAGRLFVDASGNVGVGGTPSLPFHIIGATDDIFYVERSADEVAGPNLGFRKSRGTTSSPTVLNSSDAIGTLHFRGYTGTTYATGVGLRAVVNGSPSGSRCPADFVLLTDNGSAFGERMRVTSAGLVGIGTSTPASLLHLRSDGNSAITHLQLHNRNAGASTESRIAFINSANDLSDNRFAYISAVTSGAGENGNSIAIATNANGAAPQERLRVTSAGRVGIGTSAPSYALDVVSSDTTTGIGYALRLRANTTAGASAIQFTDNGATAQYGYIACDSSSNLKFATGLTERARIDSSGRLLVGTSSARGNFFNTSGLNPGVQLEGASYQNRILGIISSDNSGPNSAAGIIMARQMSGSVGGNTAVSNNDSLGLITFQGSDGAEFVEGARIEALADGTTGANDMPGRLVFSTTADGASSPTERWRISCTGQIFQYSNQYNFSNSASTIEFVNRDAGGAKTFQWYVGASGGSPVATLSTAGVWTNASDARYKENIQDISYGIDIVKQLKPRSFDIISTGASAIGFVAQELKESVPEVIHEVPAHDGETYLNVDYGSLTAVLTKALQEAVARIEQLETAVATLQGS